MIIEWNAQSTPIENMCCRSTLWIDHLEVGYLFYCAKRQGNKHLVGWGFIPALAGFYSGHYPLAVELVAFLRKNRKLRRLPPTDEARDKIQQVIETIVRMELV